MALSALAYSSHILWSWPLWGVWHQHTSLSTNLYLKGCQLHPTFYVFLEGESRSRPYVFWWIAPQFDHVSKCSNWVFLGNEAIWKKIWLFTKSCFHKELLEFQSYSKKNHFDVCSKQIYSENFKRFSWIGLHECWKIFVLLLVKWSDVWLVKGFKIWGFQRISFQSIHFACMNNALFHMGKQSLPIQIACLWSERAWLGT